MSTPNTTSTTVEHQTEVYDDGGAWHGPTWGFRCLTCGVVETGFIKRRYAEADARVHVGDEKNSS